MTSRIASSKVLLYSTDPAHSVEVAEGWQLAQVPGYTEYFLELVFVDGRQATNITYIFYVLDLIATGFFDAVVVIPPAATWSRARHKPNDGQNPLRARSVPLGITSLSPEEQSKVHHDNRQLEYAAWFLECSLACKKKKVDCVLVFPEDLGGHQIRGPASIWQLREFQVLESVHDVRRGAGFLCQLANAEAKRPLGILTTLAKLQTELCMGWPRFEIHAEILHYVGPLPRDCGCPNQHSPMIGQSTDHHFHSSLFPTLGPLFWKRFWDSMAEEKVPLRAGKFSEPFSSSLQSPSLADGVDSSQHMFNLWKARSLNRVRLRGWAGDKEVNRYLDSMGTVTSSSSLPVSAVVTRHSWSLDALGLLVESMVHVPPVLPTSSSSATGIRQVVPGSGISSRTSTTGIRQDVPGSGTSSRTRSRSTRTSKWPLASAKQRGDGHVTPRLLLSSSGAGCERRRQSQVRRLHVC